MKRLSTILTLIVLCYYSNAQEFLPKGMTEAEKLIWKEYLNNYPTDKGTAPPAEIPRTPGEWEEAQGVVITWANYTSVLREIVRYARESVTVYIICSNITNVQNFLTAGGVSLANIVFIQAEYNSVWVRDYGPQSIYLKGTNQLAIVDWVYNRPRPLDDEIPSVIADTLGLPIYQMTLNPNRLVATGGNLMFDGFEKGFSSKLILDENSSLTNAQVDTLAKKYWGTRTYVKMNTLPYDGIHHIDMHMKLLDEETLMVGQYPQGVADGPQIEANLAYVLANFQTPYGRPYKVVRIPMPASPSGYYPPSSYYYTYTNSVILNGTVLVPQYGLSQDQEALNIYAAAMPGYNIVGINSSSTISASGSIHCITREIAANDPIFIAHPAIREANYSASGFPIWAYINSTSGISSATLLWKLAGELEFNEVPMTLERDTFWAAIPPQQFNAQVNYFIRAQNGNGKEISKPLVSPAGYYSFTVAPQGIGFDFTSSATSAEVNDEITFSYINQGIVANSYFWNFGEGAIPQTASGQGPHAVTYSTPGGKNVTLTINGTAFLEKQGIVTISEIQPTYYTLSVSASGQGNTVPESGQHSYAMGENVTLTASPEDGWKFDYWSVDNENDLNSEIVVTLTSDINAVAYFSEVTSTPSDKYKQIELFPNPVSNVLSIEFPFEPSSPTISIYSITGETVEVHSSSTGSKSFHIDLSHLPAGVYLVRIFASEMQWSKRIIKF